MQVSVLLIIFCEFAGSAEKQTKSAADTTAKKVCFNTSSTQESSAVNIEVAILCSHIDICISSRALRPTWVFDYIVQAEGAKKEALS